MAWNKLNILLYVQAAAILSYVNLFRNSLIYRSRNSIYAISFTYAALFYVLTEPIIPLKINVIRPNIIVWITEKSVCFIDLCFSI